MTHCRQNVDSIFIFVNLFLSLKCFGVADLYDHYKGKFSVIAILWWENWLESKQKFYLDVSFGSCSDTKLSYFYIIRVGSLKT